MRNRIQISRISPVVDGGRYAAKAVEDEVVTVTAQLFREGHDLVSGAVRYRALDAAEWDETPLSRGPQDVFTGRFSPTSMGRWVFEVIGWTDRYGTWLDGLVKKHRAGVADLSVELATGAALLRQHAAPAGVPAPVPPLFRETAALLDAGAAGTGDLQTHQLVDAARSPELMAALVRHPLRSDLTTSGPLPLWVDRPLAGFSTWYEFFPRSVGAARHPDGTATSGTFATAAARLPEIAAMGYDVVYLPPIHPIGHAHRKGPNNSLTPAPGDPGVPWAIGSADGGHTSVHPDLGTLEDFDDFVATATDNGLEIALDFAIQCSPDHPWVTEHPDWFTQRPDGSIAYAENPPKKYQDIYPISFDTPDIEGLTEALREVVEFWIARGVTVFRVDNPHTKAVPFWEWLIDAIHERHPEVIFLAEAFTRPHMMHQLAKVGFSQSYTYYTWRTSKHDLTEYLTELAHTPSADYFRPNFWPNTPDILHEYLQSGRPAAFKVRYALAGLLTPNMGVYSGYELCEHVPVRPGSEEYLNSEKYDYRPRDYDQPHSIAPFMTRINAIRRDHPHLLSDLRNIWFHQIDNDQLLCFSKTAVRDDADGPLRPGRRLPDGPVPAEVLLVIANLDPHHAQDGTTWLDTWQLGMDDGASYVVEDLLTGDSWTWHGPDNWVRLDPDHGEPLHVFAVRPLL